MNKQLKIYPWQSIGSLKSMAEVHGIFEQSQAPSLNNPWGYWVGFPGFVCGAKHQGFNWFDSQETMLTALVQMELRRCLGELNLTESHQAGVSEMALTAELWYEKNITTPTACQKINQNCFGLRLYWLGHFEDLCQSSSDFARGLRQRFRGVGDFAEREIVAKEIPAFLTFLEYMGGGGSNHYP